VKTAVKLVVAFAVVGGLGFGGWTAYRAYEDQRARLAEQQKAAEAQKEADAATAAAAQQRTNMVGALAQGTPLLSGKAAEFLFTQSGGRALDPAEAFRRAQILVARGLAALPQADQHELGRALQTAYDVLTPRDRDRLAAYLAKVRAGATTKPEEDREMAGVMKTAVLKLTADRRAKLQAAFEKALLVGAARR
jgi:hypothetical protein